LAAAAAAAAVAVAAVAAVALAPEVHPERKLALWVAAVAESAPAAEPARRPRSI